MNHLSLFSGIGGIDLACEWAGFNTVAFCEKDQYCQKVLTKHWPEVPIFDDIKTLTAKSLVERGIEPGTIRLVSGGFPCQPFSDAGQRLGKKDDRYLWPEMSRVIREIRPDWVLGENVTGFIGMALDDVLSDLEAAGYETQAFVIPACAVNAPHRRERVFIVAHSEQFGRGRRWLSQPGHQRVERGEAGEWQSSAKTSTEHGQTMADAAGDFRFKSQSDEPSEEFNAGRNSQVVPSPDRQSLAIGGGKARQRSHPTITGGDWWSIEPELGRVANGVPRRVDRLRALGNAIVPGQIYPVAKTIADILKAS
jgi:DNA (cytosine-5)-methyltransferase 1